jgi:hypothetical protein
MEERMISEISLTEKEVAVIYGEIVKEDENESESEKRHQTIYLCFVTSNEFYYCKPMG